MVINLKLPARPWLVLLSVAAIVVATTGGAIAGHVSSSVMSYTGCLTRGGTLIDVAEGNSPAKPCTRGAVEAHFSGGDISAISAGFGLTGGGTSGEVQLALDPAYALSQDCTTGQVVKWSNSGWACANDDDTTYSAGTGLDLTGTELSLNSNYRLPDAANGDSIIFNIPGGWTTDRFAKAGETCPTGQFVRATTNNGFLTCAAPADGGGGTSLPTVYFGKQVNPSQGGVPAEHAGIPDDDVNRVFASVDVPAGTYLVLAKAQLDSAQNAGTNVMGGSSCSIPQSSVPKFAVGGEDAVEWNEEQFNDQGFDGTFSLMTVTATQGGTLALVCRARSTADGISIHHARISAMRIQP